LSFLAFGFSHPETLSTIVYVKGCRIKLLTDSEYFGLLRVAISKLWSLQKVFRCIL
jgi:hypothetical protein